MCRTKKVETVSTGEESNQVFLGAVESLGNCKAWKITLFLNEVPIQFKIDTGAEVSVIPETLSKPFLSILKPSVRNLKGPSKQDLQVCGQFTCSMRLAKESTSQEVYVVKGLDLALVGLPAIEALSLVTRVHTISTSKENYCFQIPKAFHRSGVFNRGIQHSAEQRCCTLCTNHSTASSLTHDGTSQERIAENGKGRGYH